MKVVRSFLLALLVSLLVGFAIGTWLRLRLERRPVYIGLERTVPAPTPATSDFGWHPSPPGATHEGRKG